MNMQNFKILVSVSQIEHNIATHRPNLNSKIRTHAWEQVAV